MAYNYEKYVTVTQVPQADGSIKNVPQLNYEGYTYAQSLAKNYGYTVNPTWYDQFSGADRKFVANQAYSQMKTMIGWKPVTAPAAQHSAYVAYTRLAGGGYLTEPQWKIYNDLITGYENTAKLIAQYKSEGLSSLATKEENTWYAFCQEAATQKEYSMQSYFITSVLQKMPNA